MAVPTAPGAPVPRSGVGAGGTCVPQPYPEVVWAWGSLAHSWVSQACQQDWGHRGLCTGCMSSGQAGAGQAMPRLCPGLVPVPPGAAAQRRGWELGHCLLCPSPVGATAGHSGATRMAAPCRARCGIPGVGGPWEAPGACLMVRAAGAHCGAAQPSSPQSCTPRAEPGQALWARLCLGLGLPGVLPPPAPLLAPLSSCCQQPELPSTPSKDFCPLQT